MKVFVMPRHGALVRVFMTALLLGGCGFFASMAVLCSQRSELRCGGDGRCVHHDHYPLDFDVTEAVPPFSNASTRWDTGGRSAALKLVLEREAGERTEYQGVGTNGDRAEDTARALNAWLARPTERDFPLRSGSTPVAIMLLAMAFGFAFLLPYCFARLRVACEGNMLTVTIGRWPARPVRVELPLSTTRFGVHPVVRNGEGFFSVCAEQLDRDHRVELGTVSRSEAVAMARAETLNAWLSASG